MARILSEALVAAVQWEMLIGLEKETVEVRSLAAQRGADHAVVIDNGQGVRIVGLAALADAAELSPGQLQRPRYALAVLVGALGAVRDSVFVHPDPQAPGQMLFITRRDGQPETDTSLPERQALERLQAFLIEIKDAKVLGVAPQAEPDEAASEPTDTTAQASVWPSIDCPLTLDACLQATRESDRSECLLSPLKPPARWASLRRKAGYAVTAAVAAALAYYGWTLVDQSLQPPAPLTATPNPVQLFQDQHRQKLLGEPLQLGAAHAQAVQRAIASLPVSAGDWHVQTVMCDLRACVATWSRGEGGTFDSLLVYRPAARMQALDTAHEILALPTQVAGETQVRPVDLGDFLRSAGSRFHELSDYGKKVVLGMPEPLLPAPAVVAARTDIRPVSKGEWALQGHLAFMDSVPGLLARTRNMALVELQVSIDGEAPYYIAKGTYYVY